MYLNLEVESLRSPVDLVVCFASSDKPKPDTRYELGVVSGTVWRAAWSLSSPFSLVYVGAEQVQYVPSAHLSRVMFTAVYFSVWRTSVAGNRS